MYLKMLISQDFIFSVWSLHYVSFLFYDLLFNCTMYMLYWLSDRERLVALNSPVEK